MSLNRSYALFLVFCAACIFTSCKPKNNIPFNEKKLRSRISPQAGKTTGALLGQYLYLKNALVATNSTDARNAALQMELDIRQLQNEALKDSTFLPKEILEQADSIQFQLKNILKNNNPNCEPQRIAFKYLSDHTLSLLKILKTSGIPLYVLYCGQVFNEKGGIWLSASTEIENPYFGSKMLSAGDVIDTLQ